MTSLVEKLRAQWAAARNGEANWVHIQALPGAGRSTLLSRLQAAIGLPGDEASVLRADCADDRGVQGSERGRIEDLVLRLLEGLRALEDGGLSTRVPWVLPSGPFCSAAINISALPTAPGSIPGPTRESIFAQLLLDAASTHAILLLVDDAHHADASSRRLLTTLADALEAGGSHRLLVVITTATLPTAMPTDQTQPFIPLPSRVITLPPVHHDELESLARERLSRAGIASPADLTTLVEAARGNPRIVQAMAGVLARTPTSGERGQLPGLETLGTLAQGRFPKLPDDVLMDLRTAGVLGRRVDVSVLTRLWQTSIDGARARCVALIQTGLLEQDGPVADGQLVFVSREIAAFLEAQLPETARATLHAEVAAALRARSRPASTSDEPWRPGLDVTETWSESRRRDRRLVEELDCLRAAARHYSSARRPLEAAEAAVTLAERLIETGQNPLLLVGRWGRREDRERRLRVQAAIAEAECQLEAAKTMNVGRLPDVSVLAIDVRVLTLRARYREVMGQFDEARNLAAAAVELAGHLPTPELRLVALRTQLEVAYAAGDHAGGRAVIVKLLTELERAPNETSKGVYGWLAEALSEWEWPELHGRFFPHIVEKLRLLGDDRGVVRARLDQLAAASESDGLPLEELLNQLVTEAQTLKQTPYLAERIARYAADMMQTVVDAHSDALGGEFYPPDLYGDSVPPGSQTVVERLQWPLTLIARADTLARDSDHRIARLRVLTTMLSCIYDVRERCGELLDRWTPSHGEHRPVRLVELLELVSEGFFSVDHLESLTERTILLAENLGLDQVLADTLYEALDRELPGALRRESMFFEHARKAYDRVGDVYGLITLMLVEYRHRLAAGSDDADELLDIAFDLNLRRVDELTTDQRAFIGFRLGELLLDHSERADEGVVQLEKSIALYDQLGDVDHVQAIGDRLREVYSASGDLGRYRMLRERFRALESRPPGLDPLGLELRIEHLLSIARQEQNDERAIEIVERCVRLFGRLPDSTTRVDECFVEISKICRRRADEAQSEEGYHDWLRRSLEAVRVAAAVNRGLGNYLRLFEEFHELFDDLLGLGEYHEYLQVRAEARELAFEVGNVPELLHLFDEHLQQDPETGFDMQRLPDVRGYFEALHRYLLGIGARRQAAATQLSFVQFLTALGESELAELYRRRPPLAEG